MVTEFAQQKPGLFVLAAAEPNGKSFEDTTIEHGVFSYEVLEVLTGRKRVGKNGVVTLKDLYDHVNAAVPKRVQAANERDKTDRKQVVVPHFPGGRVPDKIPIAYYPTPKP